MRIFANNLDSTRKILLDLMLRHRYIVRTDEDKLRFTCEYNRDHDDGYTKCKNNEHGICKTEFEKDDPFMWTFVCIYNGRKMYKCPCG